LRPDEPNNNEEWGIEKGGSSNSRSSTRQQQHKEAAAAAAAAGGAGGGRGGSRGGSSIRNGLAEHRCHEEKATNVITSPSHRSKHKKKKLFEHNNRWHRSKRISSKRS